MKPQTGTQNWLKPPNRQTIIDPPKGHGHNADEWRDYDEDNVPFKRLENGYVPDEDSLKQRMNIFHGQLYSLYSQG